MDSRLPIKHACTTVTNVCLYLCLRNLYLQHKSNQMSTAVNAIMFGIYPQEEGLRNMQRRDISEENENAFLRGLDCAYCSS